MSAEVLACLDTTFGLRGNFSMINIGISFIFFLITWASLIYCLRKIGFRSLSGLRQPKITNFLGQNTFSARSVLPFFVWPVLILIVGYFLAEEKAALFGRLAAVGFLVMAILSYLYLLFATKDKPN